MKIPYFGNLKMDGMDQYSSSMIFASSFSPNLLTETLSMELFLSALRNHRTKKYLELVSQILIRYFPIVKIAFKIAFNILIFCLV